MTERIDHVAKAMTLRNNITPEEMGDPETRDWLSAAQVHATLALVEQQRIANRIAIANAIREDIVVRGSVGDLDNWLHDGNGVRGYFSEAEQEELGLS